MVAARKVGVKAGDFRSKLSEGATEYGQVAEKAIDSWAVEGEKVVGRITDGKVVEEISSKVDLDQAKEQVSKLRDQLEDMLATWRTSFRPEKASNKDTEAPAKACQEAGHQGRHDPQGFCCQDDHVVRSEDELCEDELGVSREGFLSSLLLKEKKGPFGALSSCGTQLLGSRSLAASIQTSTIDSVGSRCTTRLLPFSPMILASRAVGLRRLRSRNVSTPAAVRSSAYSAPTPLTRRRSA